MTERVCKGCGAELPPKTWQGRDRVWCSERCRKAQYGDPCVDCGARTVYGAETGRRAADPRCQKCNHRRRADLRVWKAMEMLRLRRTTSMTNVEIAEALGIPMMTVATEFHRLRVLGYEFPVSPYNGGSAVRTEHPVKDLATDTLAVALQERGYRVPAYEDKVA